MVRVSNTSASALEPNLPFGNGWAKLVEKAGISGICVILLWALLVRVPEAVDRQGDKIALVVRTLNDQNQAMLKALMEENRVARDQAVRVILDELRARRDDQKR